MPHLRRSTYANIQLVACRSYGANSTEALIDLNFTLKIHPLINNDNWRAAKFPFAPAAQPHRGGTFLAVNVSYRPSPSGATQQQAISFAGEEHRQWH